MQYRCKFEKGFCALRFRILCFAWSAVLRTFIEIHSEIGRFLQLPESMSGRLQVAVFFSLYRAGRLLDHKVALGYEASTFVQRRGKFEETSRVHIGPERVCGANWLSLSVPMHVWPSDESTIRQHAKSSARGAMRRALGHEDRLLRSALTSHRRLQRRLSWFSCPSGLAFNWSVLRSH